MTRHKKHKLKFRSLFLWHRYLGLTAAIFVFILSITGLLLNHTEEFKLDSTFIQSDLILDWYGIDEPDNPVTYKAGSLHITHLGEHLYIETKEIPGIFNRLIGAADLQDLLVVAIDNSILLITKQGEMIDHLQGSDGVPSGMHQMGRLPNNQIIIKGGHALYIPDSNFLNWSHYNDNIDFINWIEPAKLSEKLKKELIHHYRGEILPLERFLLDLHSGRIFGTYGIYIMDAAALILIFLASSGFWLWIWQKHKRRQREKVHVAGHARHH